MLLRAVLLRRPALTACRQCGGTGDHRPHATHCNVLFLLHSNGRKCCRQGGAHPANIFISRGSRIGLRLLYFRVPPTQQPTRSHTRTACHFPRRFTTTPKINSLNRATAVQPRPASIRPNWDTAVVVAVIAPHREVAGQAPTTARSRQISNTTITSRSSTMQMATPSAESAELVQWLWVRRFLYRG